MSDAKFVWYDLMTTDPAAAVAFYTETIGWKTMPFEGGDKPYTMFAVGDAPVGGVMELAEEAKKMGAPPHWLGYIHTDDIDAAATRVDKSGGQVLHTMSVPTVGRIGIFKDPQGVVIAGFTPEGKMPGRWDEETKPGDCAWHELTTSDMNEGFDFYASVFGWEKTESMDMGPMGLYQMFGKGGKSYGGMMRRPDEVPVSAWNYYFHVDGLDAAVKRCTDRGAKAAIEAMDIPGGEVIAMLMDPQNASFALHAAKR